MWEWSSGMAQWLTERFHLTDVDARMDSNGALRDGCARGYLEVAQWLVSHFHLTTEDARSDHNYAFRRSCGNGHLVVA